NGCSCGVAALRAALLHQSLDSLESVIRFNEKLWHALLLVNVSDILEERIDDVIGFTASSFHPRYQRKRIVTPSRRARVAYRVAGFGSRVSRFEPADPLG